MKKNRNKKPVSMEANPMYRVRTAKLAVKTANHKNHLLFFLINKFRKIIFPMDKKINKGSVIAPLKLFSMAGDTRKINPIDRENKVDFVI